MFRAALVYQLVLAFVAGPLLCCCSAKWPRRDAAPVVAEAPPRKSCCGHAKANPPAKNAPAEKPADPAKCPCKSGPAKDAVAAPPADAPTLPAVAVVAFDVPATPVRTFIPLACSTDPPSALSTAHLLYAHHNLRC